MEDSFAQWYREDGEPVTTPAQRKWAVCAHASALVAMICTAGWLALIGPLVIWLIKSDPYVRRAAAGSFNFNIAMWMLYAFGWVCFVTIIGIPLAALCWISYLVLMLLHHIRAIRAASAGHLYRYPFSVRILE